MRYLWCKENRKDKKCETNIDFVICVSLEEMLQSCGKLKEDMLVCRLDDGEEVLEGKGLNIQEAREVYRACTMKVTGNGDR